MKRVRTIGAALSVCALILTSSQAANNGASVLPPNSNAFGHDSAYWFASENVTVNTGGYNTMIGHVLEAPGPLNLVDVTGLGTIKDPLIVTFAAEVTLKPGTAIVNGAIAWDTFLGSDPQPNSYWGFGNPTVCEVVLDGQTVISEQDCLNYYVGPQYFNPPFTDANGNLIGAAQGFIYRLPPLSKGVHTLKARGAVQLPAGDPYNPNTGTTTPTDFGVVLIQNITIIVAP